MSNTRIQLHLPDGRPLLREGVLFHFFMRRPHEELSSAIRVVLRHYCNEIGSTRLHWYTDMGEGVDPDQYKGWSPPPRILDESGWARVDEEIREPTSCLIELQEHETQVSDFQFEYQGMAREHIQKPGNVSHISFWLPLDWLKAPRLSHVQELLRAVARELPLDSGYVSPAFNCFVNTTAAMRFIAEQCLTHPGLDIPQFDVSTTLGTRVRGAYWLNVYGPSVLEQLGGREYLRTRLTHPGISVEDLGTDKLLVSLGDQPEVSTGEAPSGFQAYRHLARVLEPILHPPRAREFDSFREQWRAWHRRFLDGSPD